MSPITPLPDGVSIAIQVQPRASRTGVAGVTDEAIRVRVSAPPVDGAANQELVRWLSKELHLPKSAISITSGERGRRKVVQLQGIRTTEVEKWLGLV